MLYTGEILKEYEIELIPIDDKNLDEVVQVYVKAYMTGRRSNPLFVELGFTQEDFQNQIRENLLVSRKYWQRYSFTGYCHPEKYLGFATYGRDVADYAFLYEPNLQPLAKQGVNLKREIDKRVIKPLFDLAKGKPGVVWVGAQSAAISHRDGAQVHIMHEILFRAYEDGYKYFGGFTYQPRVTDLIIMALGGQKVLEMDLAKDYPEQLSNYKGICTTFVTDLNEKTLENLNPEAFKRFKLSKQARL